MNPNNFCTSKVAHRVKTSSDAITVRLHFKLIIVVCLKVLSYFVCLLYTSLCLMSHYKGILYQLYAGIQLSILLLTSAVSKRL